MCSSTRGPASVPSLVTCPTSTRAKPRDLASRISSAAQVRTWATVPGALSSASSHMVWMLSMTTRAASLSCSRLATMSRSALAAASSSGAFSRPSRGARSRTCGDRLLPADIERTAAGLGDAGRGLQQDGGLADARIAADQHGGGRDQPAAQHPVQLRQAGRDARWRRAAAFQPDEFDLPAADRLGRRAGAAGGGRQLLLQGVPFAAGVAPALPFRRRRRRRPGRRSGCGPWPSRGLLLGQNVNMRYSAHDAEASPRFRARQPWTDRPARPILNAWKRTSPSASPSAASRN